MKSEKVVPLGCKSTAQLAFAVENSSYNARYRINRDREVQGAQRQAQLDAISSGYEDESTSQRKRSSATASAFPYTDVIRRYDQLLAYTHSYHNAFGALDTSAEAKRAPTLAAALEAVFPRVSMPKLLKLPREERGRTVEEVSQLSMGIRLHNWLTGLSNDRFAERPKEAHRVAAKLVEEVEQSQARQELGVRSHRRALTYARDAAAAGGDTATAVSDWPLEDWWQELINRETLLSYSAQVQSAASGCMTSIEAAYDCISAALEALGPVTASPSSSVPQQEVYPHFLQLARSWVDACEAAEELTVALEAWKALQPFIGAPAYVSTVGDEHLRRVNRHPIEKAAAAVAGSGNNTEAAANADLEVKIAEGVEIITDGEATDSALPLLFGGYCPVSLTPGRLLLPGDPLTAVRWKGTIVRFQDKAARGTFVTDPAGVISKAVSSSESEVTLKILLQLARPCRSLATHDAAEEEVDGWAVRSAALGREIPDLATLIGATTGTDADDDGDAPGWQPGYTWNEWDLRKDALKALRIQKCVTTSAQTEETSFRRDGETQVYAPRDSGSQTKTDSSTNTARAEPVRYIGPLF